MENNTLDEYETAANIIRNFISLSTIARSMVIGGLNEVRGENILGGGESEGTTKKGKKSKSIEFEFNENGDYTLSKDGKKADRNSGSGTRCVVSKTLFKDPGKYEFDLILNTSVPGSYCFGIVKESYSDFSDYTCNSSQGRSVTGSGFKGSSDSSGYTEFKYGTNEAVTMTLDFDTSTIEMIKKGTTTPKYSANFSDLEPQNGIRVGFSSGSVGESAEIIGIQKI